MLFFLVVLKSAKIINRHFDFFFFFLLFVASIAVLLCVCCDTPPSRAFVALLAIVFVKALLLAVALWLVVTSNVMLSMGFHSPYCTY